MRLKDYCKFTDEELEHLKAAHLTQDEISYIRRHRIRAKVAEEMAAQDTAAKAKGKKSDNSSKEDIPDTDIPKDSIMASIMEEKESGKGNDESDKKVTVAFINIPDTKKETDELIGDILDNPENYSEAMGEWAAELYQEAMMKDFLRKSGEKFPDYVKKPRPTTDDEARNWFN